MFVMKLLTFALFMCNVFGLNLSAIEFHRQDLSEAKGRLTNGRNAYIGQFPYQAALTQDVYYGDVYICSGALISKEYVITAAHCIEDIPSVNVLLGGVELSSFEVSYSIGKKDFIIHENFKRRGLRNDVAMIRIPPVRFSNNIKPVSLPKIDGKPSSYVNEIATFTGWGDIDDRGYEPSRLQWASMPIISNEDCAKSYNVGAISAGDMCASIQHKASPCSGDSGGPFVLPSSRKLVGLFSAGARSCLKRVPVSFVRITHHLKWIKTHSGISY